MAKRLTIPVEVWAAIIRAGVDAVKWLLEFVASAGYNEIAISCTVEEYEANELVKLIDALMWEVEYDEGNELLVLCTRKRKPRRMRK